MLTSEQRVLVACCGPSEQITERLTEAFGRSIDWRQVIDHCDAQGTLPLLSRALYLAHSIPVPEEFLTEIHEAATRKRLRSLGMAGELARIMRNMDTVHLTPITFKGPTLAYLAYGDVALRDSTDLDIYVPRRQLATALELLSSDGYARKSPGFKTSLPGACEVALQRQNPKFEVDLHWFFSSPYFLQLDGDRAISRSRMVQASGLVARTLCTEDLLTYLCIHAARECWAIRSICDLAGLLRNQPIDWNDLLREARQSHSWRAVAVGLRLAATILEAPVPLEIWREVEREPVVRTIADQLADNLSRDISDYAGAPGGAMLHLKMLESLAAKTDYLWRRALQPSHLDADFIRLPDSLAPAYYLIRPFRVAYRALGRLRPH